MSALRAVGCALLAIVLSAVTVVVDPYDGVDWESVGQHKANLHTHTTQSDGLLTPTQVIDTYREKGYTILALTDHNLCTWPWTGLASMERKGRAQMGDRTGESGADTEDGDADDEGGRRRIQRVPPVAAYEDRDPTTLGMLAVAGNEPSRHHHMGAYFIEYETTSRELEQTLGEVGRAGGLAMLFHPGRYWKPAEDGSISEEVVREYVTYFADNPHLFGVEVINQGMRYKRDIELWDRVLDKTMPERPVWGYANDDMHAPGQLGRDWSVWLIDALDEPQLRAAMLGGRSYFSSTGTHERDAKDVANTPVITSIVHDKEAGAITLSAVSGGAALPDDAYTWISRGSIVHTGPTLAYKDMEGLGNYVRAEMRGQGGTTFTNPFGLAPR